MKKVKYLSGKYISEELPGVDKKIISQIDQMKAFGLNVERIYVNKKKNILRAIPFSSTFAWNNIKVVDSDVLYIRMEPFSYPFIRLLKKCRRANPNIRIILEFPTYPYEGELIKLHFITRFRDYIYRKQLYKYIDRAVVYLSQKDVFGIKPICIVNGIDVNSIPVSYKRAPDGEIHLLSVASLQSYHGYERVIRGLKEYYQSEHDIRILYDIVGDGEAESELKECVRTCGLNEYIHFHGRKTGKDLNPYFDNADIALGSFGLYKRGSNISSALKTREYLARALPVVSGCVEDVLHDRNLDFYLEFENNETPIDMNTIIDFYNKIYVSSDYVSILSSIRKFAEENVDNSIAFKPVVDYVLNPESDSSN